MKLQNKRTGEIIEIKLIQTNCECLIEHEIDTYYGKPITLKLLHRMCEDYTPKEPLIKDENVRKAVRAWSYINCVNKIVYAVRDDESLCNLIDAGIEDTSISFVGWIPTLKDGEEYSITELCGEEEWKN